MIVALQCAVKYDSFDSLSLSLPSQQFSVSSMFAVVKSVLYVLVLYYSQFSWDITLISISLSAKNRI